MAPIPQEYDLNYYDYSLPKENIAYYPSRDRSESKLLVIDRKSKKFFFHDRFSEILQYFKEGDLLVLNDTKVFPARLKAKKKTGGEVELLLFHKPYGKELETIALIKGKRLKSGLELYFPEISSAKIVLLANLGQGKFKIRLSSKDLPWERLLERIGKVPLPPYIKREVEPLDFLRYQTVYAKKEGSIAAPTAGFHFKEELLKKIQNQGVQMEYITLHIGYGTFAPIKTKDIRKHQLEPEYIEVDGETAERIRRALEEKRRIIAVGTTVTRTLEFLHRLDFRAYQGLCDLYIYPGFEFKVISALITNFHLPKSSLLLLVCAFAGRDLIFKAYEDAIQRGYKFYSYGDATFII